MKTKIMLKFSAVLLVIAGLTACQNTDRNVNAQLDSAPVGNDSLRRADRSDTPNDVTHMSKVETLDLFRSAGSLRAEVKDFAARTLPVLEKHNEMAKEINDALK